jgi:hypothetical protein
LQPKKWVVNLARYDVEENGRCKAEDRYAAEHHQEMLDRVEYLPFQVAMAHDDKRIRQNQPPECP